MAATLEAILDSDFQLNEILDLHWQVNVYSSYKIKIKQGGFISIVNYVIIPIDSRIGCQTYFKIILDIYSVRALQMYVLAPKIVQKYVFKHKLWQQNNE